MGQQQLILLVLATVIVGIAIVVGIRAFTENSAKASVDAMTQEALRIANDAQAWKKKPAPFGGQAQTNAAAAPVAANFEGATFQRIGYTPAAAGPAFYQSVNGCYQIAPTATGMLITGYNAQETSEVRINVAGMTDAAIGPVANFPLLSGGTAINCGAAPAP